MGPYTLCPFGPMQLQAGGTSAADGGILLARGQTARLTVVVQGTGTVSAGAITLEEAYWDANDDPVYSGTWSTIGSPIAVPTGGAQVITHLEGSYWAVRARITTAVAGGGSVSVWAWGN